MIFKKMTRQRANQLWSSLYVRGQDGADSGIYSPFQHEQAQAQCLVNYDRDPRPPLSLSPKKEQLPDLKCNRLDQKLDQLKNEILGFNRKN